MNQHDYFVDESGDHRLFRKGTSVPIVGTPGCSTTFMVGVARIADTSRCERVISQLRQEILADHVLSSIPSVKKHTAVAFHACKDHPRVRERVFDALAQIDAKVTVAIRRKSLLIPMAIARGVNGRPARVKIKKLYAALLKRLLKNQLHKADANCVVCAQRSDIPTDHALRGAVEDAKRNFNLSRKNGDPIDKPCTVAIGLPSDHAGLQVVDYYLWALQRAIEQGDIQHFEKLRTGYRLIMDLDDTSMKQYGRWYSDSDPFDLQKMKAL